MPRDLWLLVLRLGVGGTMLTHGWPKFQKLLEGGDITFADPLGIGEMTSLVLTVFAEFFCSLLIALGLWVRWMTIPLIITMITAVFVVHLDDPFARQELGILYLLIYGSLLFFGGGRLSLDRLWTKK